MFKDAVHAQEEARIDMALHTVFQAIDSGDLKAAIWYLERKGRSYGFGKEMKQQPHEMSAMDMMEVL